MKPRRKSTSSAAGSPANQFRQRVDGKLKLIRVGSGQSSPVSSVYFDPVTSLWRTFQDSSLKGWDSSSLTFPRSGTMRNGVVCRQQMSEPHTSETESSLLPTPTARDHSQDVRWPTPSAAEMRTTDPERLLRRRQECKERHQNGNGFGLTLGNALTLLGEVGPLNPVWVEWLMGFPLEFTDLEP